MRKLLLCLIFLNGYGFCQAQLSITNGATASSLVNTLLGSGISVSNVVFSGIYGTNSKYQAGTFTASGSVATNLGFSSGIVLCTCHSGDIPLSMATFPGNNNFTSSGLTSCTNGEVRQGGTCPTYVNDVDVLAGTQNYYNTAILEFDFVPSNTNVSFKYVFGSEEYDQNDGSSLPINYNCSSYNDKFGFIISGPGISGGQGYSNNGRNIARLNNGSEVSINSVNNGVVGTYGGSPSSSNCTAANSGWESSNPTAEFKGPIYGIQFNGNTKVLTASQSGLTIGSTYHIKLIVTDVNDGAYDSGVFLQAASFSSPVVLPVELASFDAKCNGDHTEIRWETASEKNNDYFLLERAGDDLKFETIAKVQGSGNSIIQKQYVYNDYTAANETNYYQLVQVDKDGKSTRSKYIVSKNTCRSGFSINTVFYNAEEDDVVIHLDAETEQHLTVTICDIFGNVVYKGKNEINTGQHTFTIDTHNLGNAIYVCAFSTDDTTVIKKIAINKPR